MKSYTVILRTRIEEALKILDGTAHSAEDLQSMRYRA